MGKLGNFESQTSGPKSYGPEWWQKDYTPGTAIWQAQQDRAVRQAQEQEAKRRAATQKKQREARLGEYRGYQEGQFEDLTRGFRQFSEAQTGRALGNVLRQAEVGAGRRGIAFSGLAGQAATAAQAQLQGQALGAQQGYASQLANLQAQNYEARVRGEFEFAEAVEKMYLSSDFEKELLAMQAKLIKDQESRNAYYELAGGVGDILSAWPS